MTKQDAKNVFWIIVNTAIIVLCLLWNYKGKKVFSGTKPINDRNRADRIY